MSSRAMLRAAHGLLWAGVFVACVVLSDHSLRGDEPIYLPPLPQPVELSQTPRELAPTDAGPLMAPSAIPYFEGAAPAVPMLPATPMPSVRYWVVSSRHAPQDISRIGCAHLHVYERHCDGRLCPSGLPQLLSQLQPGAPVLVFMHGSYVSWNDNLLQGDETYHWIRSACPERPLNVIVFTWPSEQERCLLAACELKRQGFEAEVNAFYVASLLACLPDCHPICLLGHSYGARMAMAAMHLAGGGELQGGYLGRGIGRKRVRVILAAGAMDHNWLNSGGRYDRALCRTECVLNLRNRHDLVLKLYPLLRPLTSRRAIGASGVTLLDRHHQECTCRIEDFDVTGLVPGSHYWPAYYDTPALARMIASWVYFPEANPGYVSSVPLAAENATEVKSHVAAASPTEFPLPARIELADAASVRTTTTPTSGSLPNSVTSATVARPMRTTMSTGMRTATRSTATTQPRILQWWRSRGE